MIEDYATLGLFFILSGIVIIVVWPYGWAYVCNRSIAGRICYRVFSRDLRKKQELNEKLIFT